MMMVRQQKNKQLVLSCRLTHCLQQRQWNTGHEELTVPMMKQIGKKLTAVLLQLL